MWDELPVGTYVYSEQHYIDLYDLYTIEECLEIIDVYKTVYQKCNKEDQFKDMTQKEKLKNINWLIDKSLKLTKANRYKDKPKTIEKWIEKDKERQKIYDMATPKDYYCRKCNVVMPQISKTFYIENNVLFMYRCDICKHTEAYYSDGREYTFDKDLCPKCKTELKSKAKLFKSKNKVITYYSCPKCDYKKQDELSIDHSEFETKKNEDRDKLEKYRNKFVFNNKDGDTWIEILKALEYSSFAKADETRKVDNPINERLAKIKKLQLTEIEKLLIKIFNGAGYTNLCFGKPEIGEYVEVSFTLQNEISNKKIKLIDNEIKKLLEKALEDTNWRLIKGSVSIRLGVIVGKLIGYEYDSDLIKILGMEDKPYDTEFDKKYDPEMEAHSVVKLARLSANYKATENIRKRRLVNEPEGFFLQSEDEPYQCGICGENHDGSEMWWNMDGLRCKDCWENIKDGVIPSLKKHKFENEGEWFSDWQVKSRYNVHTATRDKLIRQGILKTRILKNEKGHEYFRVYLEEENKEFIKTYPK